MEERLTQPSTQPTDEATRLGNGNSGLTDEDAADIVCILHPDSEPARRVCSENYKWNPNNTISLEGDISDSEPQSLIPCDLALRLSADLKDPNLGWIFGRSHERCDVVIRAGSPHQVSNQHFRIYLNEHCILMIEDMSTNGIAVDGTLLQYKYRKEGKPHRQILENGSILSIPLFKTRALNFNFIIRVPQRSYKAQEAYENNFDDYMRRAQETQVRHVVEGGANRQPLDLFPNAANRGASSSLMLRKRREWKGGEKYHKIDMVGKGAFAVVYRVTDRRTGIPFAAKELEKKKFLKNGIQKIDSEIKIMSKIQHENVVSFVECIDWDDYLYIVMEYVPEGDLTGLIATCHHLPEHVVKDIAVQLLSALKYLHSLNVTHRDIKPDNILCQSRNPIHVKLTDFGLSKMIDTEDTFLHTFCGTLLYCAPEVYNEYPQYNLAGQRTNRRDNTATQQRYDHAVDIWSLACVLFYAFCGSPPFPVGGNSHHTQLLRKIMGDALDVRPLQHVKVSDNGRSFVVKMLHINPEHRATIEELEQSPWLTGDVDETDDEDIEELALPASQLNLLDNPESGDENNDFGADMINFQPRKNPSSFNTDDSDDEGPAEVESSMPSNFGENTPGAESLVGQEGYEFIRNPANNGRLFGEVDVDSSALGSSGAVPLGQLDLPTPIQHIRNKHPRQFSEQDKTKPFAKFKTHLEAASAMPKTPPPPPPSTRRRVVTPAAKYFENGVTQNFSSLMGAVSQLGHLQMNSPSISPSEISADQLLNLSHAQTDNTSLRRPRDNSNVWHPEDLPPQKRQKSTRTIDFLLPPQTFWNPRDKSTHHEDYPPMLATEWNRYVELAESKGEKFQHGCTTFENVMVSFRSNSKTPSIGSSVSFRAQSEPLVEGAQTFPRLARDVRRLSDDASAQQSIASRDNLSIHSNVSPPQVAQTSGPNSMVNAGTKEDNTLLPTIEARAEGTLTTDLKDNIAARNDFQVPKRVLAKFSATPDSYIPTISFNVTEPFTSWGRGCFNTIPYTTRDNVRVAVPRYAFKLLLFKNGFYPSDGNYIEEWNKSRGDEEGFRFLISTKSSAGLTINGTKLPSHNFEDPLLESKYWGEIRNGDIITISNSKNTLLKLKFECFWGMGKFKRKDSKFFLYKETDHIATIDRACLKLQNAVLEERSKRMVEGKKLAKEINHQRKESVGL
ncbi:hypothetical protein sscle_01g005520 [Sclerotinia sclerotiorum 1980 UF-70]|uniref:non-specific serine/threonine protein kinase n=1 Tax=Sclerotinia sclerotiorum (strain ATCC 18683 / 1980 / Ss-1) TaxID=665079 RepID=A0A1D9PTC9_SCLS1|nr:hypothetical protein sscle_01g005520 [Sclerotinia sclerotiorum 1980 UF-70]